MVGPYIGHGRPLAAADRGPAEDPEPSECGGQVANQGRKRPADGGRASDQHVVAAAPSVKRQNLLGQRAQPTPHPITRHGVTDPAARRDAVTDRAYSLDTRTILLTAPNLKHDARRGMAPPPIGYAQVLRSVLQTRKARGHGRSSGETLASFAAPIGKDTSASDGRHPRAKPVPSLANDDARLKRAFHLPTPVSMARCIRARTGQVNATHATHVCCSHTVHRQCRTPRPAAAEGEVAHLHAEAAQGGHGWWRPPFHHGRTSPIIEQS